MKNKPLAARRAAIFRERRVMRPSGAGLPRVREEEWERWAASRTAGTLMGSSTTAPNIASINDGLVTGVQPGRAIVSVRAAGIVAGARVGVVP